MALAIPKETKKQEKNAQDKSRATGLSPWRDASTEQDIIRKDQSKWNKYYSMYHHHPTVRAAIDKVAKTATNVGYDFVPRDSRTRIKNSELKVLKDFFDRQQDFIYQLRRIYKDLLLYGDAFMYVVPDKARRPHSLKRLQPNTIAIKANENGQVTGYVQFDPNDHTSTKYKLFSPYEILHFRIDDPNNDLYGLSPLESLEWAVAADIYAQQYNAAFFQNSGITGTIISVNGVDPDEIARNRQFLMDNYTGPQAAHKPIFLEGQSVTVDKAVSSHTDMGFLEGRRFILMEILAVLDVPPAKIGIMESANRSNSKEQDKSFRAESVSPLQYIVESVINAQFVQPVLGVKHTIFVHSEGDTRDATELMDYYTKGIAWGVYNSNEVRAKMGMAPVEGGDVNGIMAPTGFVPLDRLDLYFKVPQTNVDKVPLNEDNRDPIEGEKMPDPSVHTEVHAAVSRDVVKSLSASELQDAHDSARNGIMIILEAADSPTRHDLIKALTFFDEAKDANKSFAYWYKDVKRALEATDDDVRSGYLERLKDDFYAWLDERKKQHEDYQA